MLHLTSHFLSFTSLSAGGKGGYIPSASAYVVFTTQLIGNYTEFLNCARLPVVRLLEKAIQTTHQFLLHKK